MSRLLGALDLGAHTTKLLVKEKRHKGSRVIAATRASTPMGALLDGEIRDYESLSIMLKQLIKPYTNRIDVVLTLMVPALIYRRMELPWASNDKIRSLIELQLERVFPDQIKSYIFQYRYRHVISEGAKKISAQVYGMPRKAVQDLIQLFEKSDIKPYILDVHPNSISKLIRLNSSEQRGKDEMIAFVDIGFASTNVHIVDKGDPVFLRVIPLGFGETDEAITVNDSAHDSRGALLNELQKILRFVAMGSNSAVNRMVLYGGASRISDIGGFFEDMLNIPVSTAGDYFKGEAFAGFEKTEITDYLNCIGALTGEQESGK